MKTFKYTAILFLLATPLLIIAQQVTTLATVTANGGVTLDQEGNLYVAHFGPLPFVAGQEGKNIYKITTAGDVSLFVDNQLNVGSGNHFDSQGFLYQSSFQSNSILKIDPDGNVVNSNFASVTGPVGITVGENDTMLICACSANAVLKVAQDGTVSTFASGPSFACANGITKDDNGNFYTTNFSDGRITKIDANGNTTTLGNTGNGNGHIAYRKKDQQLYIASYGDHRIYSMDLYGNDSLLAGTGIAGTLDATDPLMATFRKPNGIEVSKDECSLYITQDDNVIREIKFEDSGCISSIQNGKLELDLKLYPIPTKGKLIIENNTGLKFNHINILNALGLTIQKIPNESISNSSIDISNLNSGIYFLTFATGKDQQITKKILLE